MVTIQPGSSRLVWILEATSERRDRLALEEEQKLMLHKTSDIRLIQSSITQRQKEFCKPRNHFDLTYMVAETS